MAGPGLQDTAIKLRYNMQEDIFRCTFLVHQKIKRYFLILKFSSFIVVFLLYGMPAPRGMASKHLRIFERC